jgi:hemolysin III
MNAAASLARSGRREEIANGVTHGVGVLLAIAGLAVMVPAAVFAGDAWRVVGCSVFGATLVLLYAASTLYHVARGQAAKKILRSIDHSAIFILIAGTYTPFTLVNLRGPWGWSLFGVVWGAAVAGIVFRLVAGNRWRIVTITLYVVMGWCVLVAVRPLVGSVAPGGLALMVAGGAAYTVGIVFYAWRRLPYHHAVWHLFVLAGSAFHYFAVLFYVIPAA